MSGSSNASWILADRYEMVARVGGGAQGEVWRAWDHELRRVSALKLRPYRGMLDDGALGEARVLMQIGSHPGLPAVRNVFVEGARWVLDMDWVGGESLSARLARGADQLLVDEVVDVLFDVASALSYLHGRTPPIVHGDLKPENLIVSTDGWTSVVDFGISGAPGSHDRAGSAGFIAPEVARHGERTPAADVYGLAATVYCLLTGSPPGIPPSRAPAGAAARVAGAVRAGLSVALDRRATLPQLVDAVREAAGTGRPARGRQSSLTIPPLPAVLLERSTRPVVGRRDALHQLWLTWSQVSGGGRHLVVASGPPGMGKSTVVSEVALRAFREGAVVLYGRCGDVDTSAYAALVEPLEHLVQQVPSVRLPLGALAVLATAIPSVAMLSRMGQARLEPGAGLDRGDVSDAIDQVLSAIASERPVMLVIDDLQWADRPTLLTIDHLVRSRRPGGIGILSTMRSSEAEGVPENRRLLREILRDTVLTSRLRVGGLEADGLATLVRSHHPRGGSPAFVDELGRVTAGNPFMVHAVVSSILRARGTHDDPLEAEELDNASSPDGARMLHGAALAHVSPQAATVLGIAAVLGHDFDSALLTSVAGLDRVSAETVVAELIDARLLVQLDDGGRLAFEHGLLRQAAYEYMDEATRSRLHWSAFRSLARLKREDLQTLAYHAHAGRSDGDLTEVYDVLVRAAEQATTFEMADHSERHLGRALDLLDRVHGTAPTRRLQLLLDRGRALYTLGRVSEMRQVGRLAIGLATQLDDLDSLSAAMLLIAAFFDVEAEPNLPADFAEALSRVPPSAIRARVEILSHWGTVAHYIGDHQAAGAAIAEARALAASGDEWIRGWELGLQSIEVQSDPDTSVGIAHAARAIQVGKSLGNQLLREHNEVVLARFLIVDGRRADVERHVAACETAARLERRSSGVGMLMSIRIALLIADGDLVSAARETNGLFAANGYQAVDEQELVARRTRCAELAGTLDVGQAPVRGTTVYGLTRRLTNAAVSARRGDLQLANECLTELATNGIDSLPAYVFRVSLLCRYAELTVLTGREGLVKTIEAALLPWAGKLSVFENVLWIDGAVDRYLGLLALVRHDQPEALDRLRRAHALESTFGAHLLAAETQHWIDRLEGQRSADHPAQ